MTSNTKRNRSWFLVWNRSGSCSMGSLHLAYFALHWDSCMMLCAVWAPSFLVLYNIPLCAYATIYVFIWLLLDIWVISCRTIINKWCHHEILVHLFVDFCIYDGCLSRRGVIELRVYLSSTLVNLACVFLKSTSDSNEQLRLGSIDLSFEALYLP